MNQDLDALLSRHQELTRALADIRDCKALPDIRNYKMFPGPYDHVSEEQWILKELGWLETFIDGGGYCEG